jgi:hypothetical protein
MVVIELSIYTSSPASPSAQTEIVQADSILAKSSSVIAISMLPAF